MRFKKFLMVCMMSVMLGVSTLAHAFPSCLLAGICIVAGVGFWMDIYAAVTAYLLQKENNKNLPYYKVKDGLNKIRENIGMFQADGKCGISATGNSGCTDEKNRAAAAGELSETQFDPSQAGELSSALSGTQKIIELNVSEKGVEGNASDLDGKYIALLGKNHDKTFDRIRENVETHVFETDQAAINASCVCDAGKGASCSTVECAEDRQNDLLIRSSQVASSKSDSWLKDFSEKSVYGDLSGTLEEVSGAKTISSFIGQMSNVSYNASAIVINQMELMTYDLRAQSYRNLIYNGVQKKDLPSGGI